MGEIKKPTDSAARVRRHRARMRQQGLKPVTLWLPDVNDPAYIADIRRQCRLVADDAHEAEVMAWIEAAQADLDLGPDYDWGPDGPPKPT